MPKAILIFINIIGFLLFTILNINEVVITHTAPKEIAIGQEVEVNLIINKNNFSGPGRLRLDLSQADGITVKENMSDGSSFTFKENEVLFIWYDLPSEKSIVISYTIIALENTTGIKKIAGDFSFINDNERKQLEVPALIFKVDSELVADENSKENNSSTSSVRSIEKMGNEYLITVKTTIDNHKGFARIKEELPMNFTAEAIETAGSIFKNADGYAKFIWTNLPDSNSEIIVKYKITNNIGLDTNFTISGVFSSEKLISEGYNSGIDIPETEYVLYKEIISNTETDSIEADITVQEDSKQDTLLELASNNEENIVNSKDTEEVINETISKVVLDSTIDSFKNVIEEEKVNKKVIKEIAIEDEEVKVKKEEVVKAKKEEFIKNIISAKKVNNNVDYKVQILAGHRIISDKQVSNQFNYNGEYALETHNGWIKYTVGANSKYSDARDSRNKLKNYNFPGPFVTAYNYGARISVQEALILTSQNWVP